MPYQIPVTHVAAKAIPVAKTVPTASKAHATAPPCGSSVRSSSGKSDETRPDSIISTPWPALLLGERYTQHSFGV
jgi:hypothetical protein